MSDGYDKFYIFYYGDLMEDDLIIWQDLILLIVYVEYMVIGECYLFIDVVKYGYDVMLCEIYLEEELSKRMLCFYLDVEGEDMFEVYLLVFYNVFWDEEFGEDVDEDGIYELIMGEYMDFDQVKWDGYDVFLICIVNCKGVIMEIVQEEFV